MRLIRTDTVQLTEQVFREELPPYAILSHTWGEEGSEVTFQELASGQGHNKTGYQKIKGCCEQAANDGFKYAWVDTCCIDKTSSAELSEAINSMHSWYSRADICYAYLTDVPTLNSVKDPCWGALFDVKKFFARSKWFSRGWTLQELLAPRLVEFFARDWSSIGLRSNLKTSLAQITGINIRALEGDELSTFLVAERMSWAAYRDTSRIEDKAYCLLGIFGVHMPLLYGEGKRAFIRLQEEILKIREDYTMFSWSAAPGGNALLAPAGFPAQAGLLADDPVRFRVGFDTRRYSQVVEMDRSVFDRPGSRPDPSLRGLDSDDSPPTLTGRGLRICLPLLKTGPGLYLACLRCMLDDSEDDSISQNSSEDGSGNDLEEDTEKRLEECVEKYLCIKLRDTRTFQVYEKDLSKAGKLYGISRSKLREFKLYTVYIEQDLPEKPPLKPRHDCEIFSHTNKLHREGLGLLKVKKYTEAEVLFLQALSIQRRILPQDDEATMCSLLALIETYDRLGKREEHEHRSMELEEAESRIGRKWTLLGDTVVFYEQGRKRKAGSLVLERISPLSATATARSLSKPKVNFLTQGETFRAPLLAKRSSQKRLKLAESSLDSVLNVESNKLSR